MQKSLSDARALLISHNFAMTSSAECWMTTLPQVCCSQQWIGENNVMTWRDCLGESKLPKNCSINFVSVDSCLSIWAGSVTSGSHVQDSATWEEKSKAVASDQTSNGQNGKPWQELSKHQSQCNFFNWLKPKLQLKCCVCTVRLICDARLKDATCKATLWKNQQMSFKHVQQDPIVFLWLTMQLRGDPFWIKLLNWSISKLTLQKSLHLTHANADFLNKMARKSWMTLQRGLHMNIKNALLGNIKVINHKCDIACVVCIVGNITSWEIKVIKHNKLTWCLCFFPVAHSISSHLNQNQLVQFSALFNWCVLEILLRQKWLCRVWVGHVAAWRVMDFSVFKWQGATEHWALAANGCCGHVSGFPAARKLTWHGQSMIHKNRQEEILSLCRWMWFAQGSVWWVVQFEIRGEFGTLLWLWGEFETLIPSGGEFLVRVRLTRTNCDTRILMHETLPQIRGVFWNSPLCWSGVQSSFGNSPPNQGRVWGSVPLFLCQGLTCHCEQHPWTAWKEKEAEKCKSSGTFKAHDEVLEHGAHPGELSVRSKSRSVNCELAWKRWCLLSDSVSFDLE